MKVGWHRIVSRDGQVGGILVADGGRIVEFVVVGRTDPPRRPSRRYLGTVDEVRSRAELAARKRQARLAEAVADVMRDRALRERSRRPR